MKSQKILTVIKFMRLHGQQGESRLVFSDKMRDGVTDKKKLWAGLHQSQKIPDYASTLKNKK